MVTCVGIAEMAAHSKNAEESSPKNEAQKMECAFSCCLRVFFSIETHTPLKNTCISQKLHLFAMICDRHRRQHSPGNTGLLKTKPQTRKHTNEKHPILNELPMHFAQLQTSDIRHPRPTPKRPNQRLNV